MINTRTNQFETALTKLVEQSQLPPVNVRLVLQNMVSQMVMLEQQVMAQEQMAAEREAKEQDKDKDKMRRASTASASASAHPANPEKACDRK